MSEWVSVKDSLPSNKQECLISWKGEADLFIAEFGISPDGRYWSFAEDGEVWHPTHWMPLPEPPAD